MNADDASVDAPARRPAAPPSRRRRRRRRPRRRGVRAAPPAPSAQRADEVEQNAVQALIASRTPNCGRRSTAATARARTPRRRPWPHRAAVARAGGAAAAVSALARRRGRARPAGRGGRRRRVRPSGRARSARRSSSSRSAAAVRAARHELEDRRAEQLPPRPRGPTRGRREPRRRPNRARAEAPPARLLGVGVGRERTRARARSPTAAAPALGRATSHALSARATRRRPRAPPPCADCARELEGRAREAGEVGERARVVDEPCRALSGRSRTRA